MVLGFRLAGVEGRTAESREEALEALTDVLKVSSVRIILIPERLAQRIRREVDRVIETMDFPLILEIPDREGPLPGRKTLKEQVKAAVGV